MGPLNHVPFPFLYFVGEHMDQFESFESKRFVSRLLGKGDVKGMMDKIQVSDEVMRHPKYGLQQWSYHMQPTEYVRRH